MVIMIIIIHIRGDIQFMKMKKPVTAQQNCQTVKENNFSIRCDDCSHCDTVLKRPAKKWGAGE
jgi:hypothetical protein